jgi:threonine dehydratase
MIDLDDVLEAEPRVRETSRHTPTEYSNTFSDMTGAEVHLKMENRQRTGSFKIRGATNRIATLPEEAREAGVVTASAGNHAQGVALAASREGVDSTIVMPENAPFAKVEATRDYGAAVILHGVDYNEAAERAHAIEREAGRTYVHAFDDPKVIAGQGTIGLEIARDLPTVDTVVVAVGGGGLVSGTATALKGSLNDVRVVGVQAAGAASAARSLQKGSIQELDGVDTIADGIATRSVGRQTFPIIEEYVDEIVTVSDDDIAMAVTHLLERTKSLVEGAGAVGLAAMLADAFDYEEGEVVVPALCGGNIDMNVLTTVLTRGLIRTGRYLQIRTVLKDRPGALETFLEILADHRANILAVDHDRASRDVQMNAAEVELDVETRGTDHVEELLAALRDAGYEVEVLS